MTINIHSEQLIQVATHNNLEKTKQVWLSLIDAYPHKIDSLISAHKSFMLAIASNLN